MEIVIALQKNLLSKPAEVIFDVGAYVGGVSKQYAELFPTAHIHAFEPVGESYYALNSIANDMIIPHNMALSDQLGYADFYVNKAADTSSLFRVEKTAREWVDNPHVLETQKVIEVPMTTIDHFCQEWGIGRIDILKMDTQGGELKVLKGAERMLKEGRIGLIYAEVLLVALYCGQAWYYDIIDYLKRYDFHLLGLFNITFKDKQMKWADAIFIPGGK